MDIFRFIIAVCIITLLTGLIIRFIIQFIVAMILTFYEKINVIIAGKIIKTILLSLIITFYISNFTEQKTLIVSFLYYFLGYYVHMVIFTFLDNEEKDIIQNQEMSQERKIMIKATSLDKYMIVVSVVVFILGITFPFLTHFYIPIACQNIYNWLLEFKIISWIFYIIGIGYIFYIIKFTIIIPIMFLRNRNQ